MQPSNFAKRNQPPPPGQLPPKEGRTTDEATAASRIQRTFRRQIQIFRLFGPDLFCMKDGAPASFGAVEFIKFPRVKPAPFITCADTASPIYLVNYCFRSWRLPQPEIIITVTGGAQDFELSPQLLNR